MNLLLDGLPETVEIDGQDIPINTGYRAGMLFEELLLDDSMDNMQKFLTALQIFYPEGIPADQAQEAFRKIVWFYRCGSVPEEDLEESEDSPEHEDPPFSYEHDADYIYSAFLQAYGIDLTKESLHWWQFRALFRSLPEDVLFTKIVGYRTVKITAKMPAEQKEHYRRMQELYRLPVSADRQKLESDLDTILMNGGNPADLLGQCEGEHVRRNT